MTKKRILKLLTFFVLAYVVFAVSVIIVFYSISKNPIDIKSIAYIRNNPHQLEEYGEITIVSRNVLYETQKTENLIKAPYTVETESGSVIVYVTIIKKGKELEAVSLEIIDFIPQETVDEETGMNSVP